ncbi:MAG: TlpA disulfide reductase family protein [Ferruginibacter sp.]
MYHFTKSLSILSLWLFSSLNLTKSLDITLLEEVLNKYTSHSSISYKVNYRIKYFDSEDTIKILTKCLLVKNSHDSVFSGLVWYERHDSITNTIKYYDLRNVYVIDRNKKKITKFSNGQIFPIISAEGEVIKNYFLNTGALKKQLSDKRNIIHVIDTIINSIPFEYVKIKFPDGNELKDKERQIFINKRSKLIEKLTYYVKLDEQIQYSEWNFTDIKFDRVNTMNLKRSFSQFKLKYPIEDFKMPAKVNKTLNSIAQDFNGKFFGDQKRFQLNDYRGKVLILDFWYMACYPCEKSIPVLNKLYKKYGDKNVLVVGVNSVDTDEKSQRKIPDFLEKKRVAYPIVFIDKSVLLKYNIQAFPTLFIIDKNGVIKYSLEGFEGGEEAQLDLLINQLIK